MDDSDAIYDNDPYPKPVSDPAGDGLPETADDDSHANEDLDNSRVADGPSPVPLPPDREDGAMSLDDFGTTAAEHLRGESLTGRLTREMPDFDAEMLPFDPDSRLAEEVDPDAVDRLDEDSEVIAEQDPIDPHLESHVSMYDRYVKGVPSIAKVGRLVQPDEGAHEDLETDAVARDYGVSGGGFGSEESAMHEMPPDALELNAEPDGWKVTMPIRRLVIRSGAEQQWEPEDLAVAEGRDPTPRNIERARRELEALGPAAIERTVP